MKKKISIRNKTIIYFSLLIAIVIVFQLVFNLFLLKPFVSYTKTNVIEKSFYQLKENYNGDIDDVSDMIDEIQNKHGIKVVLSDSNEIIYTSGFSSRQEFDVPKEQGPPPKTDGENKPEPKDNENDINVSDFTDNPQVETLSRTDKDTELVLKGRFAYDGTTLYVVMSVPMESIDASVALYTKANSVVSLVVLLIGVVLAFAFSKSLTKPITSVEKVAQSLSELDFSILADENVSTAELASLAKSINKMSVKLKSSIDDLTVANEELKKDIDYKNKIEEMRRQFIANVSHEMKTPLGLLQIYCENLKNNIDGVDKEYYCDVIIEETQNLNDMVVSMLDISSIESGLSKMQFEPLDMSALTREVAAKFKNAYDEYNLSFDIEDGIEVLGDAKYLSQALGNYISNATTHTKDGGEIKVSLSAENGNAVIGVYNDGENIADDMLSDIWTPFFKSDKARTRTNNNVGLGLYIVKTIVEKHKGTVGVQNIPTGVIFTFTVPKLTK
ncbi:MAG: HAMP domain-containing sensor histidine kinase [Clostridia bacterium]|nr:HAMP domain-containing sensor histidine kinase [Clostridia bacterium]